MAAFKLFRITALVALVIVALSTSPLQVTAVAPARVMPAAAKASSPVGPTDPTELEAFLDSVIVPQLSDAHVAGVTLSIVRDGKVFLTKGYGYADVARSIPVRPDTTLFQIGSTTKLFTWTAVMQLVEQGKLDLNADVNTYLDFKIPATYPQPITLKHLMSHSAGFEDISLGQFPSRLDQIQPLGIYLAKHIPARVRPPGVISAYSNYGADLAGYIVERVSGLPYQEYVEKNLFQTLGMERTTVRQPLPAPLAADMSLGYAYVDGSLQAQQVQLLRAQPEGAISATASDMAHFMIAHLQYGRYGNARILQEQTAQQMHRTLFRMDDRVNGFAYGFFERSTNGQRLIGHAGSTLIFNSDLILLPEQNLGLFVSYNTYGADTLVDQLILSFMNHYYPVGQESAVLPTDAATRAIAFTGSYRLTRSSYTTAEKVKGLIMYLDVTAASDGALRIEQTQTRLVPVAPLLFRDDTYGMPVVFRQEASGNITHLLIGNRPDQTFEKLSWFEAPTFHYGLLLICALLFLSVIVGAVAGWFIGRFWRKSASQQPGLARAARWLLALIAVLNLLALIDFTVVFVGGYGALADAVLKGDASSLNFPLLLWLIAAIATVGVLVFTVLAWKNHYWSTLASAHYTLVTLAALAFIWFLDYWNLLGWRL